MLHVSQRLRAPIALALSLCLAGAATSLPTFAGAKLDLLLADALATRFERAEVADWRSVEGLVVPGGSIRRVEEALRLAQLHPHLKVVLTGSSEAEVAAALQARAKFGTQVLVEPHAINTHENAVRAKQLVAPRSDRRWLLVTTQFHMPRALGSFHQAGFFAEPWPVAEDAMDPQSLSRSVRHEWGGLFYYRLSGRTPSLFPGPDMLRAAPVRIAAREPT